MSESLVGTLFGIVACAHFSSMFLTLGWLCTAVFIGLHFTSYWFIIPIYLIWYFYDQKTPFRAGRPSKFMRNLFLWKYLARYFPAKLHKTTDLDPSKNYLFACHPHGFFSFGCFVNFATNATGFDELFPGISVHLLTMNGHFKFPFSRDYLLLNGLESVDSTSIDYKLTKLGPGHSVFIIIGGVAEIMLGSDHGNYTLKLKDRKGFIRKALKTGSPVVPVFCFNEHRVYDIPLPEKGSLLDRIYRFMKQSLNNVIPIVAHGRWRWSLFVPKQLPINTVVGSPIDFNSLKAFDKGQEPPEDLVNDCHQIYLDKLCKLYDEHKVLFGDDENTPLIFV